MRPARFALALALTVLLSGCDFRFPLSLGGLTYQPPPTPVDCNDSVVATVTVEPGAATLEVGRGVWFNWGYSYSGAGNCWFTTSLSSSDPGVAMVTADNTVIGQASGTATITFHVGQASATTTVTVQPLHSTFVFATGGGLDGTCDLTAEGVAYCWSGYWNAVPLLVWGDLRFAALSTGTQRICGVTPDHLAYCWGSGALGSGFLNWWTPTQVGGLPNAVAIDAAGDSHTCALSSDGAAYCWGSNALGQLGNAEVPITGSDASLPVKVSGALSFRSLALGSAHTCGLAVDGAVYCWGDNSQGQLGTDSTPAVCGIHATHCQLAPIRAAAGHVFTTLAAGASHTCALAAAGAVYCWGSNSYGQLGTGDTVSGAAPRLVTGGIAFTSVSAGRLQTCALTSGGQAYCWGSNSNGELGTGDSVTIQIPRPVTGGLSFTSLNVGQGSSCGIANGAAYCWGSLWGARPVRVPSQSG